MGVEVTKKPFSKIIVRYGKTLDYSQYKSKTPEKENLDKVTNEMMETIIDLAIYIFSFFRGRTQKHLNKI